jgi:hypothetical protein
MSSSVLAPSAALEPKPRASAQATAKTQVRLEPHVCRECFGRVASEPECAESGTRRYFCTNCGLEASGVKASAVCACGIKLRKAKGDGRSSCVLVDAGIRCHENRARSPNFPALFVASYAGAQAET